MAKEPMWLEWRFPLPGRPHNTFIRLPADLTKAEVTRLKRFLVSLVVK